MMKMNRNEKATEVDFDQVKGFATRANAIRKAEKVLSTMPEECRYLIHINSNGRFVPVCFSFPSYALASIVQQGVAVVS